MVLVITHSQVLCQIIRTVDRMRHPWPARRVAVGEFEHTVTRADLHSHVHESDICSDRFFNVQQVHAPRTQEVSAATTASCTSPFDETHCSPIGPNRPPASVTIGSTAA